MSDIDLIDQSAEIKSFPFTCDGWRYRVVAEWEGVAVVVDSYKTKAEAKVLHTRLCERWGFVEGLEFRIAFSAPRPRWKQFKAELNRLMRERTST